VPPATQLLIGGRRVDGDGETTAVENPFTTESIVELRFASAEQVEAAVAAARGAWPGWAGTVAGERCEMLHEVARRLREEAEGLARTMAAEGGKPLIENRDELDWTAAAFDYYAEIGRDHAGRVIPPIETTQLAIVVKDPLGVVCKPSKLTPLSTLMLAGVFEHMPDGVVNLIAGAGEIGAALAEHPDVDCIAFTGSVATGKRVAAACTARMARMNLEMGGKDAFIVCADVAPRIEVAARGGAWAAFLNAGQVCTSAERFYVADEVFDEYVEAFVEHSRGLVLGDPFEVATDIGPMVSDPQRAKVIAQLEAATEGGAEILVGGDDGGQERGHFLSPAVVVGAAPDSALLREETFGPVAPLVRVGSLDEAIELANGTEFGLGANVYTGELESAVRCMRELRAGTVWINDPLTDNDAGPFGGFKQSGLGRELGREGLEAFQETKHVHIETRIERKEWWYPYREYGAE
jgi:betaine-aldehyde dehydrogenase